MVEKPTGKKVEAEIDRLDKQFQDFDKQVKDMTLDRMNQAPKEEVEQQTKLSQAEISRMKDVYLKPDRSIECRSPFNEKYRKDYNFMKEYVQFTAENREIIGETIELWTKPFAGVSAEFWKVPVNKPLWGPRYLAEQLKKCQYHRLIMGNESVPRSMEMTQNHGSMGSEYGRMVVDQTINRIDAHPVSQKKSVFMGAGNF